jgi:hypothetical protein
MPFYYGLDLGQISDHSASVILEAYGAGDERTYDCRFIEQFALGTSYPAIVASVGTLLDREPLRGDCTLAIDHTGVGRPVFDMFVQKGRQPFGVTITGGTSWSRQPGRQIHCAKILLVGTVQRSCNRGGCASGQGSRMGPPYRKSSETSASRSAKPPTKPTMRGKAPMTIWC